MRMIERRLRGHLESAPGSALAVVAVGTPEPTALAVGALALALSSEGHRVVVVDVADNRPLASILGLTTKPESMETFQLPAAGGPPVRVLVAPEDPLRMAEKPPPDDADALLVLASLDAAFGAEHLAPWVTDAVMILSSRRTTLTRMEVSREMLHEAGISLRSVILLDSDPQDDSSGALSPVDLRLTPDATRGTVEVGDVRGDHGSSHWSSPGPATRLAPACGSPSSWALLVFNVLTPGQGSLLPIPHRIAQLMTQGALFLALVLALTINPRMRMRPNWFLGLYTVLAITSLMMSVRSRWPGDRIPKLPPDRVSLRAVAPHPMVGSARPARFCAVRWASLCFILGSVVLGLFISPGKALAGGRLTWHALADLADWSCPLRGRGRRPDGVAMAMPSGVSPPSRHDRGARHDRSRAHPHTYGPHGHARWACWLRVAACCSQGDGFAGLSRWGSSLLW